MNVFFLSKALQLSYAKRVVISLLHGFSAPNRTTKEIERRESMSRKYRKKERKSFLLLVFHPFLLKARLFGFNGSYNREVKETRREREKKKKKLAACGFLLSNF